MVAFGETQVVNSNSTSAVQDPRLFTFTDPYSYSDPNSDAEQLGLKSESDSVQHENFYIVQVIGFEV